MFGAAVLAVAGVVPPLHADQPRLPRNATDLHLGVATCAGSTCHGATQPFQDSVVQQNEFVTWHSDDKHAEAYKVLLNDQSKRIARNLGIESAHRAPECLDCHADNVSEDLRGKRFQLSDGVGCEACHGGSERWLAGHVSGRNTHEDNLEAGMYPTEDPAARGRLCLSCHLGNEDNVITHRTMGAGHPRLSFELDTFTVIEPAHFLIDEDYRERKTAAPGVKVWATGQLVAVQEFLEIFLAPVHQKAGLFPELVFYDCHACHHSMEDRRWRFQRSHGLGPGAVRLNDANFLMLQHIAGRLSADLREQVRQGTLRLHRATTEGETALRGAVSRLRDVAATIEARLVGHAFTGEDMVAMLSGIAVQGAKGELNDYAAAEQGTMALASIVSTMDQSGLLDKIRVDRLNKAMDKLYSALEDEESYKPGRFIAAARSFAGALPNE